MVPCWDQGLNQGVSDRERRFEGTWLKPDKGLDKQAHIAAQPGQALGTFKGCLVHIEVAVNLDLQAVAAGTGASEMLGAIPSGEGLVAGHLVAAVCQNPLGFLYDNR